MRVDIVIPAYNEAERLGATLDTYRAAIPDPDVRLLVALDTSTDGTDRIVREHSRADARVELIEYPSLGKGGVIMETFRETDADVVGFVDADCATPPGEFLRLVDALRGADVAIASRGHPTAVLPERRRLARRAGSTAFRLGVRTIFGLPFRDTQCGAKALRRDAAARMLPLLSSRDFLFDVDLLVIAQRLGLRVAEVPTIWIEQDGSHISAGRAAHMVASTLRLWLHHRVLPIVRPATGGEAPAARPAPKSSRLARPDVAILSLYPPPGERHAGRSGVASYTSNLAHALTEHGAVVTVVAPRMQGVPDVTMDGEVRVERRFHRGPAGAISGASAAVGTGAPILHLQHELFLFGGTESIPSVLPALWPSKQRRVVTMHQVVNPDDVDGRFTELHRVRIPPALARMGVRRMQGWMHRLADRVLVHEPAFEHVLPGVTLVPHGVERMDRVPKPDARRLLGITDRRLLALCFGYVAPYKGLEAMLEAARLAAASVHVVIAGGSHPRLPRAYEQSLRDAYRDVATFTGYVPEGDLGLWFSAADLAAFPYPRPFSSSGGVALALAHETPLLLSDAVARCMHAPRVLACSPEPATLAARMMRLAAEPAALQAAGTATKQLADGRGWADVARRHLDVYEELLHDNGLAGRSLRAS